MYKASTIWSLDLCPDFIEVVVRQASFPFPISQICLILYNAVTFNSYFTLRICLRLI